MKARYLITAALLSAALTVSAEERRTVIVRDGQAYHNGTAMRFFEDGELLGGKRPYLGVSLVELTPELREHFGAPNDSGVLVGDVEDGSPADKAGVRVGDLIVAIEGKDVGSSLDLRRALREKKEGDAARVEVLRGRSRQTLTASIVEKESPLKFRVSDIENLGRTLGENFNSPEWRARVQAIPNCDELQSKLRQLESRMKDLEKKLQK